jgi:hypothetical protein
MKICSDLLIIVTIQNFFLETWEGTQQVKYMTSVYNIFINKSINIIHLTWTLEVYSRTDHQN